MNDAHTPPEDRSFGSLLSELSRKTTLLMRKEAELAKAEMSEKIDQVLSGAGAVAIGGAVLFAGLLVLLDAAVYGLAELLEPWTEQYPWLSYPWLSSLIVAAVVLIIGYALLKKGQSNLRARNLTPRRTLESIEHDKELVKEHMK